MRCQAALPPVMNDVLIRPASKQDSSAIRRVHLAAAKGPDSLERDNQNVLKWLDSRAPDDYMQEMLIEYFVVAELSNRIVGFAALHLDKEEITSVYVDPLFTRRGIASLLICELEQEALRIGAEALGLQAAGGALIFYEKQGYSYVLPPKKGGPLWADMKKRLV
jgi:GNAT superfamily N-acetyltransferase